MRLVKIVGIAAVLGMCVGWAEASLTTEVDFNGLQKSTSRIVLPGHSNATQAGILAFEQRDGDLGFANGEEFAAFCIELEESISSSGNPHLYSVIDPQYASNSHPMGEQRADMLSAWFGQYYQGTHVSDWTTLQATAFQLGVWEIVNENFDAIGTLSSGTFWMDKCASGTAAVEALNQTNRWFSTFDPLGTRLEIVAMSSPFGDATARIQDAVTVQVPEPSTVIVLCMGSGLMLLRRRHKTA